MKQHSPTPYNVEHNVRASGMSHLAIRDGHGVMILSLSPMDAITTIDEDNAGFICRACNNHDKLVAVLRAMCESFKAYYEDYDTHDGYIEAQAVLTEATEVHPFI